MTYFVYANNISTQLAAAATSSDTTLTLASATNLPTLTTGQILPLTLNDQATGLVYEVVYVTSISGATVTCTRGQEGTSALNWSIGDYVEGMATAGTQATSTGNPNNKFQLATGTDSNQAAPLSQLQSGSYTYAVDTSGTANTITATFSPAISSFVDGQVVRVKMALTNTGAATLNGVAVQSNGSALTGGELVAGQIYNFVYSASVTAFQLVIAPTQSQSAWNTGTSISESIISPLKLDTKIKTLTIGNGQTWQDVSASRASGVTYTNSTGRTIAISVQGTNSTSNFSIALHVDGILLQVFNGTNAGNNLSVFGIIPSGSNYYVTTSNFNISVWGELK